MGTRVYLGNLDPRASEAEVEDEFIRFGKLRSVWVARKPPGFAFIDFEDPRDADDAVRELNGRNGWRVEFSRAERGGGGRGGGGGARSDIWLVTAGTVVEVPLQAAAGVHPRGTAAVTGTARGPAALTVVVLGGVLHPMAAAQ
eukprot:CAMPEP_0177760344 /NCGR_PEP_ID=MMETSP0491_2-20121128/5218_1 /TAXON_ID=63592 /ORGANISM="Tetraselmis chuii, Strain PLY429" /LENGTH=142 /DNA_ID=CAMNT_0019276239 /DNA_START=45 /DNA_END=473 /DNA_ORIENTATION=+